MIGIYQITNNINGKKYIGQSRNLRRRITEHKSITKEANIPLKRAYQKYGIENFTYKILEYCKLEQLDEREIYYIDMLKPEYNITSGGKGAPSHKVSEETKRVLSEKSKIWWDSLSEKQQKSIILNNLKGPAKGHKVSQETREKLRQHNLGKKQSIETIEKRKQTFIEKKKNGYVQTNAWHKKKVICIETGKIYESVNDAGEQMKVHPSSISGVLKGRYKSCKGLHFEYYKDCSVTTNRDECNGVE